MLLVLHLLYWLLCLCYSVHPLILLQLYSVQATLGNGGVTQVRSFAKDAAPADRPPVGGDGKRLGKSLKPQILFYVTWWYQVSQLYVRSSEFLLCL
jgi:hypothetical protein